MYLNCTCNSLSPGIYGDTDSKKKKKKEKKENEKEKEKQKLDIIQIPGNRKCRN